MLLHATSILVTTPTSGDLIKKTALEGCPVEGGARISEVRIREVSLYSQIGLVNIGLEGSKVIVLMKKKMACMGTVQATELLCCLKEAVFVS